MKKFINVQGVRFRPEEVSAYRHYYSPAMTCETRPDGTIPGWAKETSYVELTLRGGGCIEIKPTDAVHSEEILAKLDKVFAGAK